MCYKIQFRNFGEFYNTSLLSFMSMMADKKVGKETFVLIYDSIYKNKFLSWKQSDRTEKLSCTAMTEQA